MLILYFGGTQYYYYHIVCVFPFLYWFCIINFVVCLSSSVCSLFDTYNSYCLNLYLNVSPWI